MSKSHNIGDLLKSSVIPNPSEVRDLQQVGSFAAGLYSRLLPSGASYVQSRPDDFSEKLSGRLAVKDAGRWDVSLLRDLLERYWASSGAEFVPGEGYHSLDSDRSLVSLYEEDENQPVTVSEQGPVLSSRKTSLFGARNKRDKSNASQVQQLAKLLSGKQSALLNWGTGESVSALTVAALESAGLPILDQVQGVEVTARQLSSAKGKPSPAIQLDSLMIDERTPALSAALQRARPTQTENFLTNSVYIDKSKFGSDNSERVRAHRAYGIFDATTANYLSLESVPASSQEAVSNTINHVTHSNDSIASSFDSTSRVSGVAKARSNSRNNNGIAAESRKYLKQGGLSNLSTSTKMQLHDLVAPSSVLYALTHENVSKSKPLIANEIVTSPSGRYVPREQRGAMWSPRSSVTSPLLSKRSAVEASPQPRGFEDFGGAPYQGKGTFQNESEFLTSLEALRSVSAVARSKEENSQSAGQAEYFSGRSYREADTGRNQTTQWRNRSDFGSDLPLAAGLSSHEAFAGESISKVLNTTESKNDFTTVTSLNRNRSMRMADLGGGLVWVAGESTAASLSRVEDIAPLSLVPQGRKAVQVPASLAFVNASLLGKQKASNAQSVHHRNAVQSTIVTSNVPSSYQEVASGEVNSRLDSFGKQDSGLVIPHLRGGLNEMLVQSKLTRLIAKQGSPLSVSQLANANLIGRATSSGVIGTADRFERPFSSLNRLESSVVESLRTVVNGQGYTRLGSELVFANLSERERSDAQEVFAANVSDKHLGHQPDVNTDQALFSALRSGRTLKIVPENGAWVSRLELGDIKSGPVKVAAPFASRALDSVEAPSVSAGTERKLNRARSGALATQSDLGRPASATAVERALSRSSVTARELAMLNRVFAEFKGMSLHQSSQTHVPALTVLSDKYSVAPLANTPSVGIQLGTAEELSSFTDFLQTRTKVASEKSLKGSPALLPNRAYSGNDWFVGNELVNASNRGEQEEASSSHVLGVGAGESNQSVGPATAGSTLSRSFGVASFGLASVKDTTGEMSSAVSQQLERNLARIWLGAASVAGSVNAPGMLESLASAYSALPAASPILRSLLSKAERQMSTSVAGRDRKNGSFSKLSEEMRFISHAANSQEVATAIVEKADSFESLKPINQASLTKRARSNSVSSDASAVLASKNTSVSDASSVVLQGQHSLLSSGRQLELLMSRLGSLMDRAGSTQEAETLKSKLEQMLSLNDMSAQTSGTINASRALTMSNLERQVVALERQVTPGLHDRVAQTMATASLGPAGARRLLLPRPQEVSSVKMSSQLGLGVAEIGLASSQNLKVEEQVHNVGYEELNNISTAESLRMAALNEEQQSVSTGLSSALAPEVMLSGARSHVISRIQKEIGQMSSQRLERLNLSQLVKAHGLELSAHRDAYTKVMGAHPEVLQAANIIGPDGLVGNEPQFSSTSKVSYRDMDAAASKSGLSVALAQTGQYARRGMLSALLKQADKAELVSLLQQHGAREFAESWGTRVDGSKTGLDLGYGVSREELDKTFGRRRSALSEQSVLTKGQAHLLSTVGEKRDTSISEGRSDKSGLRRVSSELVMSRTGAVRPQHQAERAIRRTDWRFVDTGSRATTTHADLGKLAAAVVSNSEASKRTPMPLVAPAVKAVAQTALRKSTTESDSQPQNTATSSNSGGTGAVSAQSTGQPKLTEQAIELLAVEMANRVARLMGLMKERIGVWA